jgi:hypothetical protein
MISKKFHLNVLIPKFTYFAHLYLGNANWQPDNSSPKCQACLTYFSTFTRRHHCRNCGQLVCGNCSSKRYLSKRVCDNCLYLLKYKVASSPLKNCFTITEVKCSIPTSVTLLTSAISNTSITNNPKNDLEAESRDMAINNIAQSDAQIKSGVSSEPKVSKSAQLLQAVGDVATNTLSSAVRTLNENGVNVSGGITVAGMTVRRFPNGDVYMGQVNKDGMICGKGVYTFANGCVYTGEFHKGIILGNGVLKYDNCSCEGEFWTRSLLKDDVKPTPTDGLSLQYESCLQGKVIMKFSNGSSYEGDVQYNSLCGHGKFISATTGKVLEGRYYYDYPLCWEAAFSVLAGPLYLLFQILYFSLGYFLFFQNDILGSVATALYCIITVFCWINYDNALFLDYNSATWERSTTLAMILKKSK